MADESGVITTSPVEQPTQAEPSPAPSAQERLNSLSSEERKSWQMTGKMPEKAEAAPAKESSEIAPASETGKPQEPAKKEPTAAEKRIRELHAQASAEKQRADRLESELAAARAPKEPQKTEAAKPAENQRPTANDLKTDGNPKYSTWEELNSAQINWEVEQRLGNVDELVEKKLSARQQKDAQDRAMADWNKSWDGQVAAVLEKHGDYKEVVVPLLEQKMIPMGGPVDIYLAKSPHGAELFYHLGKNQDDLQRILAIDDPVAQFREIAQLEFSLTSEKKAEKSVPAPPKVTTALKPPAEVGGTATTPPDELVGAIKNHDFTAFKNAGNRRELASKKTG